MRMIVDGSGTGGPGPEKLDHFAVVKSWEVRSSQSGRVVDEEAPIHRPADRAGASAGRAGHPVAELCRKLGVSETTFYHWKKKYAGMGVAELRRVKQCEEENRRLKQVVADLTLDKAMLQDVLQKKA
jgi:putative transposase